MNDVKRERRYLKALFFVMFLAFGAISPFAPIFFKRVLLNDDGTVAIHLIGVLAASMPVVGFLANVTVGVLSDKFGLSRRLITMLSFMGASIALLLGLLGTHEVAQLSLEQKFTLLFFAVLAFNFVIISLEPLVTSQTLQHLGKHSDRNKFGTIRIWGTYGWAVSALITGTVLTLLTRYVNFGDGTQYRYIYFLGASFMFILGILGFKAGAGIQKKPKIYYSHIVKDKLFMRFLIFTLLEGIVRAGALGTYLSYFLDDVTSSPLQIGMIYCFWTTFEIPVMANSDKLLKTFGNRKLFMASLAFATVQLYLFSMFSQNTPFALMFGATLIHGLSFSLGYIALMDYLDRYAHKDMKTSYLAAMNISRTTVAAVIGGALGAFIIAGYDSTMLMRIGAVSMLVLAVIFVFLVKNPPNELSGESRLS